MSQLNAKTLMLGQNADPAKNFKITVPTPEDGTLTIERGNGTDVMKFLAAGGVAINGGVAAPAAGMVGELLSVSGGPVDIGFAGAPANFGNIPLPAGVWDIQVTAQFVGTAGTTFQRVSGSLVNGALGNISNGQNACATTAGNGHVVTGFMSRQVFSVPTTVFLVCAANGPSGQINCTATMNARRVA